MKTYHFIPHCIVATHPITFCLKAQSDPVGHLIDKNEYKADSFAYLVYLSSDFFTPYTLDSLCNLFFQKVPCDNSSDFLDKP